MTVINVPQVLKVKLGISATEALVQLFTMVEQDFQTNIVEVMESRFEKRLIEETGKLRIEMHALRADIIRWMFLFWIGQLASFLAIFKFIKIN